MRLSPNRAILALLLCVWMVVPFVNSHAEDAATPASGGDAILSPTDLQHAERCPICKDFAYKHHNPLFPSFQCLPQPMRQRGLAEKRRMVCPVCNTVHDVEFVRELDPKGGIDTDFCYHPLKDADYTTNIYTCTNCGYTAYAGGFYEMPMGRKAVDADLESAIDRHFMLESSFKSWVRSNLARPLHDKLTELAKQIHPDQDWTAIKSQASIPLDMKLDYLHRCYSRLGVSYEFLAGMYMRFTYIYRNQFCEAKVTSELKRGYILTLPLLFESESFENETEILEGLGSLKHGELAYTLGIKWGEYSVRELIDRYIEVIRMINGIMDGTAKQEDINRAKVWGLTEPDLLQAKFVLFLELSSAYLRLGDLTLSQKSLEKAEALNEGDKLFANFPEKATKEQLTSREQAKIRTRLVIQEKMRDFVNHLKYLYQSITYLKESIRHKGLRAIYYPTQTYLVGNLYYRVELYDVAKLWFKMAKRSSVIYDFLNLPPKTRSGFNELLNSMLEDPLVANAKGLDAANCVDVEYLDVVRQEVEKYDEAQDNLLARPQECKQFLEHMWVIFSRYQVENNVFPPTLESLVRMGLVDEELNNGFRCPVTDKKYGYTPPSLTRPNTIYPLMYDEHPHDDESGIMGYILYSDGDVKQILSHKTMPKVGTFPE